MGKNYRRERQDSYGARVSCELFYCAFTDIDDQVCYVVGVRELGEGGRVAPPAVAPPMPTGSRVSNGSPESNDSHSSNGTVYRWSTNIDSEIAVTVDIWSEKLDITSCTEGFCQLGGPSSLGVPFLGWLESTSRRTQFSKWFVDKIQALAVEGSVEGVEIGQKYVRLSPLGMPRLKYRAKCVVYGGPNEDEVCIVFREVMQSSNSEAIALRPTFGRPTLGSGVFPL
eukprot:TRINITY_DN15831_c0_g2_i2.p1 TRINITY_DN15831_c0_g2~~TRINITY_DN15831_c0_g2_i2.p1  ORF type:complete len:226 (+),score=18.61 TRINITY_DN15831_c0_g2_i2:381-1058(+)